jgi:hypothetical protein
MSLYVKTSKVKKKNLNFLSYNGFCRQYFSRFFSNFFEQNGKILAILLNDSLKYRLIGRITNEGRKERDCTFYSDAVNMNRPHVTTQYSTLQTGTVFRNTRSFKLGKGSSPERRISYPFIRKELGCGMIEKTIEKSVP